MIFKLHVKEFLFDRFIIDFYHAVWVGVEPTSRSYEFLFSAPDRTSGVSANFTTLQYYGNAIEIVGAIPVIIRAPVSVIASCALYAATSSACVAKATLSFI